MKQSRIDFIKDLHSNVDVDLKEQIELEFPKLFLKDKLEVGKWYKTNNNCLFLYDGNKDLNGNYCGVGFLNSGKWMDNDLKDGWNTYTVFKKATEKEVEASLINEAKKRGFKKSVTVDFGKGSYRDLESNKFYMEKNLQGFYLCLKDSNGNGDVIFRKGKWATIIETITKEEAEKQLGKTIIC